jgi:hypothetical protein
VNAVAVQVPPPVRAEDVEEARLVEVDQEFLEYYGPDFASWKPWQVENYVNAIAAAHAEFAPEGVAA